MPNAVTRILGLLGPRIVDFFLNLNFNLTHVQINTIFSKFDNKINLDLNKKNKINEFNGENVKPNRKTLVALESCLRLF